MKRVHTSLSVEVAMALRERSAASQHTQTDILAEAFVMHGRALVDEHDAGMRSQYEAFGFRPKRPSPRQGRMTVTFYLSELARNSLDDMANEAGHHSRSAYIDAILRRHLGLPD